MLHLLLIDDSLDDRLLSIHELKREFSNLKLEQVIDAEGFNKALITGNFDIVITDYRLGWNDGLTVLRDIKSRYPNCPVIMFTDSGSQEIAVEAMKAGLDDYIIKSPKHYFRLTVAVRSALKRAESQQRATRLEMRLQDLLNRLNVGVFRSTLDGHLLEANASFLRLLNASSLQEARTLDWYELLLQPESGIQRLNREREVQLRRVDGSSIWVSLSQTLSTTEAEPVIEGLIEDITLRKQVEVDKQQLYQQVQLLNTDLEQQVQERTAQLQQAFDFEAALKRITDKVRDSLDENQILQTAVQELALALEATCCEAALYNLDPATSTICYQYTTSNKSCPSLMPITQGHMMQISDFPEGYHQLLQGQYFQVCEIEPGSTRSQIATLVCPIFDDQGALGNLRLFRERDSFFNALEVRLVQQVANQCAIAMRQARLYQASLAKVEELEKLNQLKDDFLSTVSHELRTPISNMKMAIHMLKMAPTVERQQRYLEILKTECARELELINDLLDLQRLSAASYNTFLVEAISLHDWLPNIVAPLQSQAQERQQTLHLELPSLLPSIIADRASLERLLVELLNNACKYTVGGEIVLSVECTPRTSTIFTISNSTEIPAAYLPHIFEKFYRVPNADPWKQGGTGLGLALVQKLVEQMQGTIKVESFRGWTTFTVELPNQSKS